MNNFQRFVASCQESSPVGPLETLQTMRDEQLAEAQVRWDESTNPLKHLRYQPKNRVKRIRQEAMVKGVISAIGFAFVFGMLAASAAPQFETYDQDCRIELNRLVCN